MSVNIFQLHIKSVEIDEVKAFLVNWLEDKYGRMPAVHSKQDSSFSFFHYEIPTHFALCVMHDGWVTVLHDSYDQLEDLTSRLSSFFRTKVIHALAQSTVDTYHLTIFQEGKLLRRINFGEEYAGIDQYGEPLPFEKIPLGSKAGTGEDDYRIFDYNDMSAYCLHFNIDLLTDPAEKDGSWEVIQVQTDPASSESPHIFSIFNNIFSRSKKGK
jgi:hypothetical protein